MSVPADIARKAHAVIDALVAAEPRPATFTVSEHQWAKGVRNRIRSQRWADLVEHFEHQPDADPERLAAEIAWSQPTAPAEPAHPMRDAPVVRATDPLPEGVEVEHAKARIAEIRSALQERRQ